MTFTAPPSPSARRRTETVRADLDTLFAEAGTLPAPTAAGDLQAQDAIRVLRPEPAPRNRTATYGAIAVAVLAGVSIGAVLTHGNSPASPPSATVAVATIPPAAAVAAPTAPPTDAPAPAPVKVARREAVIRPAGAARAMIVRQRSAGGCAASRAGCDNAAVQAADHQLRTAYDRAIRARVPRRILIDYQERWQDLRESDADRPRDLVRDYDALAQDLGRAARAGPTPKTEPMDPPPLRWPF